MAGTIEGTVVAVSASGDLVTDITSDHLRQCPRDHRVVIRCDEHETNGLYEEGHSEPTMTLLAVINSQGTLELRIVGDSAVAMLGIGVGEKVTVQW